MDHENSDAIRLKDLTHYGFGTESMKQIKVCRECGAKADAGQDFCRECGTPLPKETLYDLYRRENRLCPLCGSIVSRWAVFCPKCGARLETKGNETGIENIEERIGGL